MSTCSRAGAVQLIALAIQKQVRDSKETHFASDLYFQIPFVLCVCVCILNCLDSKKYAFHKRHHKIEVMLQNPHPFGKAGMERVGR